MDVLTEEGRSDISVEDVGALSAMTTADVLHTLQNLNMLRYSVGPFLPLDLEPFGPVAARRRESLGV